MHRGLKNKNSGKLKKKYAILFIILIALILVVILSRKEKPDLQPETESLPFGIKVPEEVYPPWKADMTFRKPGFTLGYDESREQAAWVCYLLTREKAERAELERKNHFILDPEIMSGSAASADYTKSGYDRGHLAPSKDMAWSEESLSASFQMSNISPQIPGFNRGIWKELEQKVREWAVKNDSIILITGPVFRECSTRTIGKNKVVVPHSFYKIVIDISDPDYKAAAFLIENEDSRMDIWFYSVSIDSIEFLTGLDFMPNTGVGKIEKLESEVSHFTDW